MTYSMISSIVGMKTPPCSTLVLLEKVLEADVRINRPDVVLPRHGEHHANGTDELRAGLVPCKGVLETRLNADEPKRGGSRIDGMPVEPAVELFECRHCHDIAESRVLVENVL